MSIIAPREPDLTPKNAGFVYQVQAVKATRDLPFAAIFHEQGLGKTKIGLDLALYWISKQVADSVLIVTKRGLIQNWIDELSRHTHVTPRVLSQNRQANFLALNSPARIYLAHYEVLRSEHSRLRLFLKTRRVAAILDEAHKIKNPDSEVTATLLDLAPGFVRRVIMTGTPVANRPFDLWAQIFFLDQGASLGRDFASFRSKLNLSNDLGNDPDRANRFEDELAAVFKRIESFAVRDTKRTADIALPEKFIRTAYADLEPNQAEMYERFKRDCASVVVKRGIPQWDEAADVLKRLLRLVQVAANPRLVDHSYRQVPGKFLPLLEILSEVDRRGEKAIVWSTFIENVDWLARELAQFAPRRVHGKLSHDERAASLKAFKSDPECRLLIATPASAKEGLTLTVANNAVFFDRSFSLDDYLQAQDRIHRISQVRDCTVTNIIASGTIDEWVDTLLAAKQLAAQLAQGDITKEQYDADASYSFGEMLREVLGLKEVA